MSQSISSKIVAELLKFWPKNTAEECEKEFNNLRLEKEQPCPAPKLLKTRYEDKENGRIFYLNEDTQSRYIIFYIHGGAYRHQIILPHWQLIEKLVKETYAQIIVPAYRLIPYATYIEAYDLITEVYTKYCELYPNHKIIMMGDSAGGGLSLGLTEYFKRENVRMPDELILISPWVDVTMENEDIEKYQPKDTFLNAESLKVCGKYWAKDSDPHDWKISPVYGDLSGIHNVTGFVGTYDILCPDILKCFEMLDPSNELVIEEKMNHVYPLLPIPEAKPAVKKIIQTILR